jgi:hypothetical protein
MKKKIKTNYKDNEMFRWYSDVFPNLDLAEKIFLDIKTKLKTTPHPYCGWRSTPNQKYDTIFINKFGLRSPDIDILDKKSYCLLFGGSVAWGFGASKNEFIPSYQIENFFKINNIDIDVINLSQNAMNSHDELRSFVSSVDEIKPKMVICLSGVNDLWQLGKGYNKCSNLLEGPINFFNWGQTMGIATEKNYFKKYIKLLIRCFKKTKKLEKNFFQFEKSPDPFELFKHKIDIMQAYCDYKKIIMVHVLQPNLFYKKKLSESEKKYLEFWKINAPEDYYNEKEFRKFYEKLKLTYFNGNFLSDNSIFIDSTSFFDEFNHSMFFDVCHMSDKGNEILSKKIVENIKISISEISLNT